MNNMFFILYTGAHFGTTYAHLLFQSFSELVPAPRASIYQPRIFGFRVNEKSNVGPRMQWLRMRPPEYVVADEEDEDEDDLVELDDDDPLNETNTVVGKASLRPYRHRAR